MLKRVTPEQLERGTEIVRPQAGKVLRVRDFGVQGVWVEYRSAKTWMIRMAPIWDVRIEVRRRKRVGPGG